MYLAGRGFQVSRFVAERRAKSMSVGVSELKPAALSQPVKQEEGLAESMRQPSAGPSAPPTTRLPSSTVENAEDTVVRS